MDQILFSTFHKLPYWIQYEECLHEHTVEFVSWGLFAFSKNGILCYVYCTVPYKTEYLF